MLAMDWHGRSELRTTPFTNMTIDGEVVAAYKDVGNFSFACVPHLVPFLSFVLGAADGVL